jgi:hypothetical protein
MPAMMVILGSFLVVSVVAEMELSAQAPAPRPQKRFARIFPLVLLVNLLVNLNPRKGEELLG